MKRILAMLLAVLCLAALLSGCSSNAVDKAPTTQAPAQAPAEQPQSGDSAAMPLMDPGNAVQSGKKIIYTVQMTLEVGEVAAAVDDITGKTAAVGGYVSQSSYSRNGNLQNGTVTVRIPPDKLREFTDQLRQGYKALSSDMTSEDVTNQFVDLQSRLTNAQAQETQLMAIMKQAVAVDDILKVRKELDTVQQEIEQLKGQLRLMDNQVGYCTVKLTLREKEKEPVVDKDEGNIRLMGLGYTWDGIRKNFVNGLNATLNALSAIVVVLSAMVVPLLAVAVVIGIIVLLVHLLSRRGKKR